jgi:excisionase family DNA binding protein
VARLVTLEERHPAKQEFEPNVETTSLLRAPHGEHHSRTAASGMEVLLTSKEASQVLKIHPKVLERMAKRGEVPALKVGKFWRYRATALDAWINSKLQSNRQPCRIETQFWLEGLCRHDTNMEA